MPAVYRSDNRVGSKFGIAETPDSFRILSDGLYTDKHRAVIRELGTNALDSHVPAGTLDTPVEIQAPCMNEPFYKVRDFGTGMDAEKLESLYVTYFWSDKKEDKNQVGQLGLGSKSPFCVCNAFTIASYVNGKKLVYSAFISEGTEDVLDDDLEIVEHGEKGGYPEIVYLGESIKVTDLNDVSEEHKPFVVPTGEGEWYIRVPTDTDESDGVEISVPVESCDYNSFRSKIAEVYQYFRPERRPKVVGEIDVDIPVIEYVRNSEENGWGMVKKEGRAMAIMGNVCYPIVLSDTNSLSTEHKEILSSGIHIRFHVGQLDFVPSRESLQDTPRTRKRILRRFDAISEELRAELSTEFDGCKTLWDARILHRNLFGMSGDRSKLARMAGLHKMQWDGQRLGEMGSHRFGDIKGVNAQLFKMEEGRTFWRDEKKVMRRRTEDRLTADPSLKLIERDMDRGAFSRVERGIRNGDFEMGLLVEFDTAEAKSEFIELMGMSEDNFTQVSKLPKYAVEASARRTYAKVFSLNRKIKEDDGWGRRSKKAVSDTWMETEVDIAEGGYYVTMSRQAIEVSPNGWNTMSPREVNKLRKQVEIITCDEIPITGFRKPVRKKVMSSLKWINFISYANEAILKSFNDTKDLESNLHLIHNAEYFDYYNHMDKIEQLYSQCGWVAEGSAFHDLVVAVREAQQAYKEVPTYDTWFKLISQCKVKWERPKHNLLGELYKKVVKECPMLKFAFRQVDHPDVKHAGKMVQYVKLVLTK